LLVTVSIRFNTIHDVFSIENKKVCFYDRLYRIIERTYPSNLDNLYYSSENDTERLLHLQNNDQGDGVVIFRYSLSFIYTQIKSFCDSLYPLYDENLFTQEVIVAISQTLGELGDELVIVMDTMVDKDLYRDRHDDIVSSADEGCDIRVTNNRNRIAWESFLHH